MPSSNLKISLSPLSGIAMPQGLLSKLNIPLLPLLLWLAACTGTHRLPEGERLYTGAKVRIEKAEKSWETGTLAADLKRAVTLPRPNKHILWLRPGVSIYNTFHSENGKGLGNAIAKALGKEPVLFDENIIQTHRQALVERAANDGFFSVGIKQEYRGTKKKVKVRYTVSLFQPAKKFSDVALPPDTSLLEQKLQTYQAGTLIKTGDLYRLETLTAERQRLSDSLRNEGWYYFSPDFLQFVADTLSTQEQVKLRLTLKETAGEQERRLYYIGEIFIYPDYDVATRAQGERSEFYEQDSCIAFIYNRLDFSKRLIVDNLRLRCGALFSTKNYQNTLFRLLNLNFFKFVSIRFEPSLSADSLLDVHLYLTPPLPQKIEWKPSAIFSPGLYFGGEGELTYLHRNVFRGGENLRVSAEGSWLQFSTVDEELPISSLFASKTQAQLIVPQSIFGHRSHQDALTATKFTANHEALWFNFELGEAADLGFVFNEIYGEAGFTWKKNRLGALTHEANPVGGAFNFVLTSDRAAKLALLENLPTDSTGELLNLLTSIEYRPNYIFTLDNRFLPNRNWTQFLRQRFAGQTRRYFLPPELSDTVAIPMQLNFYTETDARQYLKLSSRNVLAGRLAFFFGIPVAPNSTIPLQNLYTVGGASSVRGFAPRSVGPGSSQLDVSYDGQLFLTSHTGNLLLEGSVELRHRLSQFWEAAIFLDAGNVWLTQDRSDLAGETFDLGRFFREFAVAGGVGLRFNLGFFVIRLDLAAPLSKPYLPEGERLVFNQFNPFRKDGARWNLAFGYPF